MGLANRLRALVGYQALSHFLNVPFYLCWIRNAECDADFSALFETELKMIAPDAFRCDDPEIRVFDSTVWFHEIWREHLSGRVPRLKFFLCLRGYLDKLVPVRPIFERVNAFASMHGLENALGVHIRQTDNVQDYERQAGMSPVFDMDRVSSLPGFLQAIESQIAGGKVFLATDNREVEELCERRYGGRLVTYPKQYKNVGPRTTNIEDALTDMALLGRCGEILGTYYSSYSQFSAIWSDTAYREVIGKVCERSAFVEKTRKEMRRMHWSLRWTRRLWM